MDEVDDILDQNRAAQQEVEDEEDEEDDEEDETILRNNMDKEADERGQNDGEGDQEGPEDEEEEDDDEDDGDNDEVGDADNDDDEEDEDEDEDEGDDEVEDDDENEDEDEDDDEETKGIKDKENMSRENGKVEGEEMENDENTDDKMDIDSEEEDQTKKVPDGLSDVHNYYTQMLHSAKIASSYKIYPTAAIPIQTEVNAVAMSKGLQYLFLGGSDGFIRKYDFLNTMDGKLSLTILQKHSLAESIQNAGILMSYWENEVPQRRSEMKLSKSNKEYDPKVSPVYAIEVQSECLFLLSGLDNGGITMQGVRYMEGSIGHYFKSKEGHTNVVNQLRLNGDETKFISGSWDKRLLEWDLSSGGIVNEFKGSTSEISSLEMRPLYATVDINDVVREMKQSKDEEDDRNSDDDMGSLFGDEEEEEDVKKDEHNDDFKDKSTKKLNANHLEEISRNTLNVAYDESVFLTSGLNGSVDIWDRRIPTNPVINLERGPKVPPWCQSACWCMDGDRIYAGRRNACVEEFDLKMPSRPSNTLRLPAISGPVTCVRAMPNNKQILCASRDNIRLYNTGNNPHSKGTAVPFLIVPGHHGGAISNMYVDPTCRFLVSTSGNRGWQGNSTDTTFIYEIDLE